MYTATFFENFYCIIAVVARKMCDVTPSYGVTGVTPKHGLFSQNFWNTIRNTCKKRNYRNLRTFSDLSWPVTCETSETPYHGLFSQKF